jgi:fructose-1,6-bisphosphatase/inositol monophosphatase family enzyme
VIVDPLDGTAPYLQQLNFYAVSLLFASEFPRAAILHQPSMGTWLVATFPDGPNWAAGAHWFTVSGDGQVLPGAPPKGPDREEPIADSYLDVSSDVHRWLDLTKFSGKLRARGATASGFTALIAGGGADPRAIAVTRAKVWDVAAGLVLAEAIGLRSVELKTGATVNVSEMLSAALGGGDPVTPPLVVARPGDRFVEGVELR